MRQFSEGRRDLLLVGGLILLSLTLMTLQVRHRGLTTPIERILIGMAAPIEALVHKPVTAIRDFTSNIDSVESLRESNELLQTEVQRLRTLETKYEELLLKQARLERLLQFKRQTPLQTVAASVIARDSTNWSKTLTINVGSDMGLRNELPVLNHDGIVGHLIRVAPNHSQVLLITDVRGAVDSLIQRTRTAGIFVGSTNGHGTGFLQYVPREADVRENDRVISSGYGKIYPKGIPVGIVKKVDRSGHGLFQTVEVKPVVDFSRLEEVLVVLDHRPDS